MKTKYSYKKEFSLNLKRLLKQHGLSQRELAEIINCSTMTVNQYANNKVFPSFEKLIEISNIFNISIDELIVKPKKINKVGNLYDRK